MSEKLYTTAADSFLKLVSVIVLDSEMEAWTSSRDFEWWLWRVIVISRRTDGQS